MHFSVNCPNFFGSKSEVISVSFAFVIPPPPPIDNSHKLLPIGNSEFTTLPNVPGTENAEMPTNINAKRVTTKKIR
jgi:hypothetical protein